jgi:hypothetical protein
VSLLLRRCLPELQGGGAQGRRRASRWQQRAPGCELRGGGEPPHSLLSWRQLGAAALRCPADAPLLPTPRSFPTTGPPHAALLPSAPGILPLQTSARRPARAVQRRRPASSTAPASLSDSSPPNNQVASSCSPSKFLTPSLTNERCMCSLPSPLLE